MSYELFVQRFEHGAPVTMRSDAFDVFRPYVDSGASGAWLVRVPDGGEAEIFATVTDGVLDSLMISRFSSGIVLDLLVEAIRRAHAVIVPPGCPVLLVDEGQRQHLPDELRSEAVVVVDGSGVQAVLLSG